MAASMETSNHLFSSEGFFSVKSFGLFFQDRHRVSDLKIPSLVSSVLGV